MPGCLIRTHAVAHKPPAAAPTAISEVNAATRVHLRGVYIALLPTPDVVIVQRYRQRPARLHMPRGMGRDPYYDDRASLLREVDGEIRSRSIDAAPSLWSEESAHWMGL